jgi:glycine oxidase
VKNWDAIIVGAGIIGLSLALELHKTGLRVLIVDKGEPGHEASWAAGGMLCDFPAETAPALLDLAAASARMYPEFVRELEDESRLKIDLRAVGTLVYEGAKAELGDTVDVDEPTVGHTPASMRDFALPRPLAELEPALQIAGSNAGYSVVFVKERCVDPRDLIVAAIAAARRREIDFSSGDPVMGIEVAQGKACGVRTNKTRFAAGMVVNCAGAWAGQIGPHAFPTRPVKGQMLSVIMPQKEMVRHVIRTPEVYLIPRTDGRMVIGATSEEAGFDKRTVPETIQRLRQAAVDLVPKLVDARMLQAWAGLRPGTPDKLPILGATATPGYFVATGHFRDGILLAPVTAKAMADLMTGRAPQFDLANFSAARFGD